MAVKKKVENEEVVLDEVTKEETKIEKTDEAKELKEQLEKEKQEKQNMQDQINQLQAMMLKMMEGQQQPQKQTNTNERIKLVSNAFGNLPICDGNGKEVVLFKDSGHVVTIRPSVLDSIMTAKNKDRFFSTGIVEFVADSEKYYDEYFIDKPYSLDTNGIKSLYEEKDYDKLLVLLDKLTEQNKNDLVKMTIFWQTIRLIAKDEIGNNYINSVLKSYFECKDIERCVALVCLAKDNGFVE